MPTTLSLTKAGSFRLPAIKPAGRQAGLVHGGLLRTSSAEVLHKRTDLALERRDFNHWIQRHVQRMLWQAGVESSLGGCLQGTFQRRGKDGRVINRAEIHTYPDGGAAMVGVTHCASPLCPVCGPILAGKRLEEAKIAAEKLLAAGYTYIFPTFTAKHPADISLVDFMKIFKAAWRDFYNSPEYKWLKRHGWRFSISAVEVTDDDPSSPPQSRTGWHLHRHAVDFYETGGRWFTEEEIEAIRLKLLAAWRRALEAHGLTCSADRGVYIQTIQHHAKNTGLRVPFDRLSLEKKQAYVDQVVSYVGKSLGFELTGTARKKVSRINAKGGRRVSARALMEAAVQGDRRARDRWVELFKAYQAERVNHFRMSPGLRDFCAIREKTEKELLEGEAGKPIVVFGPKDEKDLEPAFDFNDWLPVARQGRLGHLLKMVDRCLASEKLGVPGAIKAVHHAVELARADVDIMLGSKLGGELPRFFYGEASGYVVADVQPSRLEADRLAAEAAAAEKARRRHAFRAFCSRLGASWDWDVAYSSSRQKVKRLVAALTDGGFLCEAVEHLKAWGCPPDRLPALAVPWSPPAPEQGRLFGLAEPV